MIVKPPEFLPIYEFVQISTMLKSARASFRLERAYARLCYLPQW